jgi:hypothetical protein
MDAEQQGREDVLAGICREVVDGKEEKRGRAL